METIERPARVSLPEHFLNSIPHRTNLSEDEQQLLTRHYEFTQGWAGQGHYGTGLVELPNGEYLKSPDCIVLYPLESVSDEELEKIVDEFLKAKGLSPVQIELPGLSWFCILPCGHGLAIAISNNCCLPVKQIFLTIADD